MRAPSQALQPGTAGAGLSTGALEQQAQVPLTRDNLSVRWLPAGTLGQHAQGQTETQSLHQATDCSCSPRVQQLLQAT